MFVSKKRLERIEAKVEKLETQLTEDIHCEDSSMVGLMYFPATKEPTISGKVDAIANHLGISFDISPKSREKVITKLQKKGKK